MKLNRLYIENFGNLSKFSYDFESGLNVINKPNGWGKSTLASFVKAMFYGLTGTGKRDIVNNERKKHTPWGGGRFGGNLEFEHKGKGYRIERFFGNKEAEDTFVMYDTETSKKYNADPEVIVKRFFDLDVEAFERSVFFPQNEIRFGLNDSISAKLSNLVENTDDINNYNTAIDRLDKVRQRFKRTGGRGEIAELESAILDTERKITACKDAYRGVDAAKVMTEQKIVRGTEVAAELKKVKTEISKAIELREKNVQKVAMVDRYNTLKKSKEQAQTEYDEAIKQKNKIKPSFILLAIITLGIAALVVYLRGRKENPVITQLKITLDMRTRDYEEFCRAQDNVSGFTVAEATALDLDTLRQREVVLQKEYDRLKDETATLRADAQAKQERAGELTEFEASLEALKEKKIDAEYKLDNVKLCIKFLEQAKQNINLNYVDPMKESFGSYAEIMADGDLGGYVMDSDLDLKFERHGETKSVDFFNAGHRDIVDICVRLSLIDALYKDEKPFIIMDDPFVNLDEDKISSAMDALKRLSEIYQIIYFTCHKSRE
ncbi:MAG: AAA family ATPase [Firmicutes bacterium]|nr:AAA family ATPase [Bacillota bacterium]